MTGNGNGLNSCAVIITIKKYTLKVTMFPLYKKRTGGRLMKMVLKFPKIFEFILGIIAINSIKLYISLVIIGHYKSYSKREIGSSIVFFILVHTM